MALKGMLASRSGNGHVRDEYEEFCRARIEYRVEVREPLVLISQIHRSGGTLLSQLFDGHPECHAHPHELTIGYPKSRHWPPIDLRARKRWFEILYETPVEKHFHEGYRKPAQKPGDAADVFPFLFLAGPPEARSSTRAVDARDDPAGARRARLLLHLVLQRLARQPEPLLGAEAGRHRLRAAAAHEAGERGALLRRLPRRFARLDRARPARLVRVRAHAEGPRTTTSTRRSRRWRLSAEATLDAAERYGDRVVVLTYEQLVLDTEATMRRVADRIGITMAPILLEPTFNGRPIRANSSDRRRPARHPARADERLPRRAGRRDDRARRRACRRPVRRSAEERFR